MTTTYGHTSVLLDSALDWLVTDPEGIYVDGTYGRGGHSRALLARLGTGARVLGIDQDPEAVRDGKTLEQEDPRFRIQWSSFADIERCCRAEQVPVLDGLLLDLGVSSPQLDDANRGFSFQQDGPLDMRMNPEAGQSAAEWVNSAPESELIRVFFEYGEERFARRMARAIVERRVKEPFVRTLDLAAVVRDANPRWEKHKHPATRVFQAIRIHINGELEALQACLEASLRLLRPGGRLVVISFHSLEDRLVKRFMRDQARGQSVPRHVPVVDRNLGKTLVVRVRGERAGADEVARNVRARSAVLRVAERLPGEDG